MKKKIIWIFIILIILGGIYFLYINKDYIINKFSLRKDISTEQKIIDLLTKNSDMIVKLEDRISKTEIRLINETLKKETIVKPDDTYTALKDKIIELEKDSEKNKEELEKLKEEQSENRQEFLGSDYRLYIRLDDDTKLIFHRNPEGALIADTDRVTKIIEHKELPESSLIREQKEIVNNKTNWDLKFGGYYSLDKTYGLILSKGIFTVKDYSINASLLIADIEDFKLVVGGDIDYSLNDDFLVGVGYSTDNQYYLKLQYQF